MHSVNGIKIAIAASGLKHTRSIPEDLTLHIEYDRIFISRRNGSMTYDINENGNVTLNTKKGPRNTGRTSCVKSLKPALLPSPAHVRKSVLLLLLESAKSTFSLGSFSTNMSCT